MNRSYLELYEVENGILIRPIFSKTAESQWDALLSVGRELQNMSGQAEGRWLLLSDPAVYGKIYGDPHAFREDEMGYISHTAPSDGMAWMWRMTEQLFFNTLRENHISGCAARVGANWSRAGLSRQDLVLLERLIKEGKDMEVYNINLDKNREVPEEDISPLRPLPHIMDTRKEGNLG